MSRDYIPSRDADLVNWSLNFSTVLATLYASYGLSSGQASSYATLDTAFSDAYSAATDPVTRTPVTVAAKDAARSILVATARQYAQIAQRYPGITDELLAQAGLTVKDPIPSPIPPPVTYPVLSLIESNSLQLVLRTRDSVLSNPRSKPPGVIGMELYVKVGTTPPATIADCKYAGMFSRVPATVDFAGADAGDTAYFIGRWINGKGQPGPASAVFAQTIAA